jgi:hypothetical protein
VTKDFVVDCSLVGVCSYITHEGCWLVPLVQNRIASLLIWYSGCLNRNLQLIAKYSDLHGYLQHGLYLRCFFKVRTSLRPYFIDGHTVCELNKRQTFGEVDVEYTLSLVSITYIRLD